MIFKNLKQHMLLKEILSLAGTWHYDMIRLDLVYKAQKHLEGEIRKFMGFW